MEFDICIILIISCNWILYKINFPFLESRIYFFFINFKFGEKSVTEST